MLRNLGQLLPSLATFEEEIDIKPIRSIKGGFISKDFIKTGFIKADFIKTKDIQENDNKVTLALRRRNLDSAYLYIYKSTLITTQYLYLSYNNGFLRLLKIVRIFNENV